MCHSPSIDGCSIACGGHARSWSPFAEGGGAFMHRAAVPVMPLGPLCAIFDPRRVGALSSLASVTVLAGMPGGIKCQEMLACCPTPRVPHTRAAAGALVVALSPGGEACGGGYAAGAGGPAASAGQLPVRGRAPRGWWPLWHQGRGAAGQGRPQVRVWWLNHFLGGGLGGVRALVQRRACVDNRLAGGRSRSGRQLGAMGWKGRTQQADRCCTYGGRVAAH